MKKTSTLLLALSLTLSTGLFAQTEWTGPMITIEKEDFADWTQPENQDLITDNVILTRADSRGLFNIAIESEFDNANYLSPLDTEWANGSISDGVGTLTFQTWDDSNGAVNPTIGENKVLHLITDDIYIDFVVTAWTQGAGGGVPPGGGFSYMRSTDQAASLDQYDLASALTLSPNPAVEFLQLSGVERLLEYRIINLLGSVLEQNTVMGTGRIDISSLDQGVYFIQFEDDYTLKFVKN